MAEQRGQRRRRRLDLSRTLARILCALFALIGVLPLAASILVRSEPVRHWAAIETARILQTELGVTAHYRVEVHLLPLQVALVDLDLPASDGGSAFLTAKRVGVRPRIFSLLAGKLDAGDIEIDEPRVRVVLRDGKLANLTYRLPESKGPKRRATRAPFASLAINDAGLELDVDGMLVKAGPLDLDVLADEGPSFDIGVRAAETSVARKREYEIRTPPAKGDGPPTVTKHIADDEDVICELDARVHIEPGDLLVRRLALTAMADADPASLTRPSCAHAQDDAEPNRVFARLSQLRLRHAGDGPLLIDGHATVHAPIQLTNRFVRMLPLSGWIEADADVRWDGTTKLPELRGKIQGKSIEMGRYRLASRLLADVAIAADTVVVPRFEMMFAEGLVVLNNARIQPFAPGATISAERVDGTNMSFSAMMRDLGVTPNTIVKWDLKKTRVTKIAGTLAPLKIDAELFADTRDFELYDRAYHDPHRRHMLGVRSAATVHGRIAVRPMAFEFYDTRADFGKSSIYTPLVSIGFNNDLELVIKKGSHIELADGSPLIDIPWKGRLELEGDMRGKANDPILNGTVAVAGLEFGGFPLGDIKSGKVQFRPLKVDFSDVHLKKGKSEFVINSARLDFEAGASVVADAAVKSEGFDLRDFMAMWLFDSDPRFDAIHGDAKLDARVHYVLGGPEDRCGGGYLGLQGALDLKRVDLYDERYDSGHADFEFRWADREASYLGFELDAPSITLKKGSGTLLGSLSVRQGGVVRGNIVGTALPISKIDSFGELGLMVDGRVNAVAEVGGTVDELTAETSVRVSQLRIGGSTLPGSELSVKLVPIRRELKVIGKTRCGLPKTAPFDRASWDEDEPQGVFHVAGQLFGGQVRLDNIEVTRQRYKTVKGEIALKNVDLGALAEMSPNVALSDSKPRGKLGAKIQIEEMPLDHAERTRAKLVLDNLEIEQSAMRVRLQPGAEPITMHDGRLDLHGLALAVKTPQSPEAIFDVQGSVQGLGRAPQVDAMLALRPTDLSSFAGLIPRAERVQGSLAGKLHVTGSPSSLRYRGGLELSRGEIMIRGLPAPITNLGLAIEVDNDELRISRGSAKLGSGTIRVTGSAPLRGFELGAGRAVITARELSVPLVDGVRATVDADLVASYKPSSGSSGEHSLPQVTGDITLLSFEYTRPVTMTADITSLAQRGRRTNFEAYDPADDFVDFDVTLRANKALVIKNNLIETELELDRDGLLLAGSNQRFGLRGSVRIKQGGRIRLRQSEFEIRQGWVRFDDLTRIAPQVDVTAVTEYRRYNESQTETSSAATTSSSASTASIAGGRWRITMHAYGDADKLKVDLTSEPALAQDDIFLLLTVGLTRAELDQAQSASVGESVALEALGTLTGADKAVKSAVPVIDEFRFGSAYSSRTGRTEPTVTIGKRLAERIRANVTSGLADSREVRSNIEWRLSPRVSVEGSYDNVNDISSSQLGNLGADVRWRLEFE